MLQARVIPLRKVPFHLPFSHSFLDSLEFLLSLPCLFWLDLSNLFDIQTAVVSCQWESSATELHGL